VTKNFKSKQIENIQCKQNGLIFKKRLVGVQTQHEWQT